MAANFRIDQSTPGNGITGRSRTDLVAGESITLVVPSPAPGAVYSWEIVDKAGSSADLSGNTGTTVVLGLLGPLIVPLCAFMIRCTETIGTTVSYTERIAAVRGSSGLRPMLYGELGRLGSTIGDPDYDGSTDNSSYENLAGTGVSSQNWRSYAESFWELTNTLEGLYTGSSDLLSVSYAPENYAPTLVTDLTTSTSQLGSHLHGLDLALASISSSLSAHHASHQFSGSDAIAGEKLSFARGTGPTNYTAATDGSATTSTSQLGSHIKGIDTALGLRALSSSLAAVATTGAYSSLTGTPTLAAVATAGTYASLTGIPSTFTPSAHASTHISGGGDAIAGESLAVTLSVTNYTAGTATLSGHLSGIDSALLAAKQLTSIDTSSTSFTPALSDAAKKYRFTSSSAIAYTVPPNSSVAYPVGTILYWRQAGTGQITFSQGSGVTLNPDGKKSTAQYAEGAIVKTATNTWDLVGSFS